MNTELYIKDVKVEIGNDNTFPITKTLSDLNNLSNIVTDYSKTIVLPRTTSNDYFFNSMFRLDSITSFSSNITMSVRERPPFKLYYNSNIIASGIVKLTGISPQGYNILLQSDTNKFLTRLKDINLNNLYLSGPNEDKNSYLLTTSESMSYNSPVKFNRPNISLGGPVYDKTFFENSIPLEDTSIPYYESAAGSWIKPLLTWNGEEDDFEKDTYWNGSTIDNKYDYPKYNKDLLQWSAPNLEYGIFFKRILEMVFNDATVEGKGITPFEGDNFFSNENPYYSKLMLGLGNQFDEKEFSYTTETQVLSSEDWREQYELLTGNKTLKYSENVPTVELLDGYKVTSVQNLSVEVNSTSEFIKQVPFTESIYKEYINNFESLWTITPISIDLTANIPSLDVDGIGGASSGLVYTANRNSFKDNLGNVINDPVSWLKSFRTEGSLFPRFVLEPIGDTSREVTLANGNKVTTIGEISMQLWNYSPQFVNTGDMYLESDLPLVRNLCGSRLKKKNISGEWEDILHISERALCMAIGNLKYVNDNVELVYLFNWEKERILPTHNTTPLEPGKRYQIHLSGFKETYEVPPLSYRIYQIVKTEQSQVNQTTDNFVIQIGTLEVIQQDVRCSSIVSTPEPSRITLTGKTKNVTLVDSLFNNNEDSTLFDYFSEYVKMFNLYLTDTKDGNVKLGTLNSILKVNTDQGEKEFLDWSDKIDSTKTTVELSSGVNNITFSTEDLETTNGQRYLKSYSQQYGNRKIIINPESNIDQPLVESMFTFPIITDNYEFDYNTFKRIHVPIKLINKEEVDSSEIHTVDSELPVFFMDYDSINSFNAVINFWNPEWEKGAWSSVLNDWNVQYKIGFSAKDEVNGIRAQFATPSVSYDYYFKPTEPSRDIYQICWERYIEELYNPNTKILTTTIYLSVEEYQELSFGTRIYINNTVWRLNSIKDFNLIGGGDCTVELISVLNYDNLINTFNL